MSPNCTSARRIRLEAATSRLEDIAEAQAAGRLPPAVSPTATTHAAAAARAPVAAAAPPPPEDPASVQAYDADVTPAVQAYAKLSGELGPIVKEQVRLVLASIARGLWVIDMRIIFRR